jgi:predicted RNase H-like HicB family nuclease
MAIHDEVLGAALRICRERGGWHFTPDEIVRSLPTLNASSVRTHIVSRCCVGVPKNHPHKWDYFRRLRRGVYEVRPAYRRQLAAIEPPRVAETAALYGNVPRRDTIHATVTRGGAAYVAECWELAVVTQGRTLDEVVVNLREALSLHLDGEDMRVLGLASAPRLVVSYESPLWNVSAAQTARR